MAQEFKFRLNVQGINQGWVIDIPTGSEPIIIGRQAGVGVLLEHQQVSRRHAALYCTSTECQIADLGSANGTRLNGQKLTPQVPVALKPGDSIQIGGFKLDIEQIPIKENAEIEKIEALEPPPQEEGMASDSDAGITPPMPPNLALDSFAPRFDPSQPPPGLTFRSDRLMNYLPSIYHTDFMASFLAIFESVLFPIEWQIDNFDLFLDPGTAPSGFLPWLANWFGIVADSSWSEAQQRAFLKEAYQIYSRSGTIGALSRVLEIYSDCTPEIDDQSPNLLPHTFRVKISGVAATRRKHLERLIDAYKPAHTTYILEMDM
jgi:phage tail-like protein